MQILKTKLKFALLSALTFLTLLVPATAHAADCKTSATPPTKKTVNGKTVTVPGKQATPKEINDCLKNNTIVKRLNQIISFLSAGVGIVVTGVIVLGGIQYIIAGDNATALTAARQRITNGLIALAVFLFIYAILQWLVPGGVFG
jgi:hypothetical protein